MLFASVLRAENDPMMGEDGLLEHDAIWSNRPVRELASPLPLAGEVGAKRRVGALSPRIVPSRKHTPALPRKRERERSTHPGGNLI
ncbi:hypothetical protein ACVJGD_004247 [Bradyrhizobium sp. USDA 10063]